MHDVVLNNREELFIWIKENHKSFDHTSYLQELSTINDYTIRMIGGSNNGGISLTLSFPSKSLGFEVYPVKFNLFDSFPKEKAVKKCFHNGENIWLIKMLLQELLRKYIGFR